MQIRSHVVPVEREAESSLRCSASEFLNLVGWFVSFYPRKKDRKLSRTCYPEYSFPSSLSSFHKSLQLHVQLCQSFDLVEVLKLHLGF